MRRLEREIPKELALHLILDNCVTHKHSEVKRWLEKNPRFNLHFTANGFFLAEPAGTRVWRANSERLCRGGSTSVPELIDAIYEYLDAYNKDPKPLVWTAKVEDILRKVSKCKAILETVH